MSARRRSGSVVLGLLVALATLFGVACLCASTSAPKGPHAGTAQIRSADFTAVTGGQGPQGFVLGANGQVLDLACLSPGHQQCDGTPVADTPTTGPVPQPQPLGLPARPAPGEAGAAPPATRYAPPPRPPDLHVLQVLRT
ncbi:hypothetical protein AB0O01_02955 [Streptomyces sp. NPDC093252]|uniref:hypothetical protein n=1 Tax=Streptomyces sp. NPDC093252 TaxID=3154980 RepID=UPI0034217FEE